MNFPPAHERSTICIELSYCTRIYTCPQKRSRGMRTKKKKKCYDTRAEIEFYEELKTKREREIPPHIRIIIDRKRANTFCTLKK